MTIETSDVRNRGNDPARLAAAEDPALASHHNKPNGASYNEAMVESIPSRGHGSWGAVVTEWKWIAAILSPFGLALALYFIPATKGELESVKSDAASRLEIAKAGISGQQEAVKAKIDALQSLITDTRDEVKGIRGDLKAILQRLPDRSDPPAYFPPAPLPAKPPATDRKARQKPAVQPSFWSFPRIGN
jgi:hypothetical protein